MNSKIASYAIGAIAAFVMTAYLVFANDPSISGFASLSTILMFANVYALTNAVLDARQVRPARQH